MTRSTRLIWEIEGEGGVTKRTVIHGLEGAPKLEALVAGKMEDVGAGAAGAPSSAI